MTDLYTVLGITRDATPDEVRKAYRVLALQHHPDRGGDPAAFQAATEAHDVLSDPERRAQYDATGEVGDGRPRNPNTELMMVLVPCLHDALKVMAESGEKVDKASVVAFMRRVLEKGRAERKKMLEQFEKARASFAGTVDRFQEPEGEGLLAAAARHHLSQIDAQVERVVAEDMRLARALEYLAKCRYEFTPRVTTYSSFSAGTTSWWMGQ